MAHFCTSPRWIRYAETLKGSTLHLPTVKSPPGLSASLAHSAAEHLVQSAPHASALNIILDDQGQDWSLKPHERELWTVSTARRIRPLLRHVYSAASKAKPPSWVKFTFGLDFAIAPGPAEHVESGRGEALPPGGGPGRGGTKGRMLLWLGERTDGGLSATQS